MPGLIRKVQRGMGKAIRQYKLIEEGDRIMVCVSGGADSLVLLKLMLERQQHISPSFSMIAAFIDLGFNKTAREQVEKYFLEAGVDYKIVNTKIAEMALDPKAKKSPCFICSHHRRHEIYKLANSEKCNKIAFGHHKDDIVETLLLNILYSRKIEGMRIRQEVFGGSMYVIRPMGYLEEEIVKKYASRLGIRAVPKMCKMDGFSRRQTVKELIKNLQAAEKNANIRSNIFRSLYNVNVRFAPGEDERL